MTSDVKNASLSYTSSIERCFTIISKYPANISSLSYTSSIESMNFDIKLESINRGLSYTSSIERRISIIQNSSRPLNV